jgi:adenylate cyclase
MKFRDLIAPPKHKIGMPAWLVEIISLGIVTTDPDVVRRQRCVNVAAFGIVGDALNHLIVNSFYDFHALLSVNIYNVFIIVVPLVIVTRLHRFGDNVAGIALALVVLLAHLFVVWSFGLASGVHMYYTVMAGATLFFFGAQNWRLFLGFLLLFVGALLFAVHFAPVDGLVLPGDDKLRDLLSTQVLINMITLNAAMLFYALTALHHAELQLKDEHQRSEALIETVMPGPIAERLKGGEQTIADRIDMLSVTFTDLVDFTGAAHHLAPEEVVGFLDALVRSFDAICHDCGAEKIKTIGDSYMAAAGFDGRAEDGAEAIGRFALNLLASIEHRQGLGGRELRLRIGIHCGPATAGVIGDTRFSYDIWGDAVNTASRMESHGQPNRIHVSEAYRDLAAHAFDFEERGMTDIKGLGVRKTFFLVGLRTVPAPD